MKDATKKKSVLFISGYGRSGSTLIELLLAKTPGFVVVGEVRHLFGRVISDRESCGCGLEVTKCPYWKRILAKAFPDGYDREEIYEAFRAINRVVATPQIMFPLLQTRKMKQHIAVYTSTYRRLYEALLSDKRAVCIVDSSKYPLHSLVLTRELQEFTMTTMLLTRDPRAVAHSWENPKVRPEITWEKRMMPRHNFIRSAFAWLISNKLTEFVQYNKDVTYIRQRYEDFTKDPLNTISHIASTSSGKKTKLNNDIFQVSRSRYHTIAGNPLESVKDSEIIVKNDGKWKRKMNRGKQIIVWLICFFQLKKYGYRE